MRHTERSDNERTTNAAAERRASSCRTDDAKRTLLTRDTPRIATARHSRTGTHSVGKLSHRKSHGAT